MKSNPCISSHPAWLSKSHFLKSLLAQTETELSCEFFPPSIPRLSVSAIAMLNGPFDITSRYSRHLGCSRSPLPVVAGSPCGQGMPHTQLGSTDQSQIDFPQFSSFSAQIGRLGSKSLRVIPGSLIGRKPLTRSPIGQGNICKDAYWLDLVDNSSDWAGVEGATLLSNISPVTMECS